MGGFHQNINLIMCSITGFITFSNTFDVKDVINSMNNQLTHRGPDQSNIWINKENNLALGHNRLSIIDFADVSFLISLRLII